MDIQSVRDGNILGPENMLQNKSVPATDIQDPGGCSCRQELPEKLAKQGDPCDLPRMPGAFKYLFFEVQALASIKL
jgi:hypothetical protein